MQKQTLFDANHGKFDPVNSTYKHEIYLSNGKLLTGYSKGLNIAEMPDKDRLIQTVIARLYKNGYLHYRSKGTARETVEIIFYSNDPIDCSWICTLYPKKYVIGPDHADNQLLKNFLDRLYEQIKTGIERKNLVKAPKHRNLLNYNLNFKDEKELLEYVNELINSYGIAKEIALKYYEKMLSKLQGGKL